MKANNINDSDLGYWYRGQAARSLDDLDKLIQYKLHYASKLAPEKVKDIEDNIHLYADAD